MKRKEIPEVKQYSSSISKMNVQMNGQAKVEMNGQTNGQTNGHANRVLEGKLAIVTGASRGPTSKSQVQKQQLTLNQASVLL